MKKSTLLHILSAFSKKEWRDLEKWLQASVHNQREDVRILFDYLRENTENEDALEKATVWKAIFPKQPYDDAFLRQVMYFLNESAYDFIAHQQMQEQSSSKDLMLLNYFRRQGLEKPFQKTANALRRKLDAQDLRNSLYLDNIYRLERETFDFKATQRRSDSLHLQETGDALDLSFIATKLRIGCAMLSHQSVNRTIEYDKGLLPFLLEFIQAKQLQSHPAIAGFYHGYLLGTGEDETENFEKLRVFIEKDYQAMSTEELRELYRMALNFCIRQVNTNQSGYAEAALELYKNGIEQGALLESNGQISRFTFFNTIGAAIKVGAFDWAEQFVLEKQHLLGERQRTSTAEFNLARIFFERKDYEKAQRLLINYEYDDLLINLLAKTMLLKIYYEEGELDALESLIGSMGAYLKRKEALDDNRRIGYKNFLKIVKKLINMSPNAKSGKEKIQLLISETNPLMERNWLESVSGTVK